MNFRNMMKKKRFWLGVATAATAASYLVGGDIAGAVRAVASFAMGS